MKLFRYNTSLFIMPFIVIALNLSACNTENTAAESDITGTDSNGSTTVNLTQLATALNDLPVDDLNQAEADGLLFMREEEKLAYDVYVNLYAQWGMKVFDNISKSEQTHTDAMLMLLNRYNITDPVGNNAEGVFVDTSLQNLYDTLIAQGSNTLIDALLVGAAIEEIDIIDIQNLVDALDGNADIALVYESLMKGSRNHLRAFVRNLETQGVVYQPQYLSQEVYDVVINADFETN